MACPDRVSGAHYGCAPEQFIANLNPDPDPDPDPDPGVRFEGAGDASDDPRMDPERHHCDGNQGCRLTALLRLDGQPSRTLPLTDSRQRHAP